MLNHIYIVALVASILGSLQGQDTPAGLAEQVLKQFTQGSPEQFEEVFPFAGGRELVRWAVTQKTARKPGFSRVVEQTADRAVLLLSGYPVMLNSGDETIRSRQFAGVYEAVHEGGAWRLSRELPLDEHNRILAQQLYVTITPNESLRVAGHVRIEVKSPWGFAARLNHTARIHQVQWDDRPVEYSFGGGLIWVRLVPGARGRLSLDYEIEVEEGPNNTNSGCFLKKAGHVRNQYFWHPFFDFNSPNDQADFEVTVRIPSDYRVATSVPQTERIEGRDRVVQGKTIRPTMALSLLYDRDWQPVVERLGDIRLELFLASDFQPDPKEIIQAFQETIGLLSQRFGSPPAGYFAVAQGRSRSGGGWHYTSNQLVVAGLQGGPLVQHTGEPRAYFGHEVAHLWTQGAGPAANFLQEGWATFVEGLILREKFGPATVDRFWKSQADAYFSRQDGKASILQDPQNEGVAYSKGSWIFAMLEHLMGSDRFNQAMADFSRRSLERAAGLEDFVASLQRVTPSIDGLDLKAFVMPWLTEKLAPRLSTRIDGAAVVITQSGPFFPLLLELEIQTESGKQRRKVLVSERETIVQVGPGLRSAVFDPDHKLLLKR